MIFEFRIRIFLLCVFMVYRCAIVGGSYLRVVVEICLWSKEFSLVLERNPLYCQISKFALRLFGRIIFMCKPDCFT